MILDALKKVNNSLNTTSKSLFNEDLKSLLNIHHVGLDAALNVANNGNKLSNPITYLKFKVIDSLKNLSLSKKILSSYFKEQLSKIDEEINNPLARKDFLMSNIFKPKNEENYLKADTYADVVTIHEEGLKEATDSVISSMRNDNSIGIKRKILNPFNDIVFDLEMQTDREYSNHGNRVLTMDTEFHDINAFYIVQVKTNSEQELKVSADPAYNKLINFEYTLYHELAHTSYNQMTKTKKEDSHQKEIHSDLCAIIKMIKNHDMKGPEVLNLCKEIFISRLDSANTTQYFDQHATLRAHFTEVGLIDFTSSISKQIDNLKALKDNEIGDFVETFMQESMKKESNILPEFENKEEFVKTLLDKYLQENIGENLKSYMNSHIHSEIVKTKFYEKGQFKLKELYTPETTELAFAKIKSNMFNSMMSDDRILTDIYMQNKSLEKGAGNLFVSEVVKKMPDGRQLGVDAFEKFELYKQLSTDLKSVEPVKMKNTDNTSIKVKPN